MVKLGKILRISFHIHLSNSDYFSVHFLIKPRIFERMIFSNISIQWISTVPHLYISGLWFLGFLHFYWIALSLKHYHFLINDVHFDANFSFLNLNRFIFEKMCNAQITSYMLYRNEITEIKMRLLWNETRIRVSSNDKLIIMARYMHKHGLNHIPFRQFRNKL